MILQPSTRRALPERRNVSLPVITGLGHEIDTTIADEVAHTAENSDRLRRVADRTSATIRRRHRIEVDRDC